ncbi:DDE-type integrase/transposase/recombinase [Methylobacterium soli]|uniref:DDE-type integrase/transposase/recombinase n=1 Tax=Methylobacterium soli TaxID=553447 RepID=A0A6L3SUV2_9HYPH|nr:DDE-type integrase/transposase/recombinase [Methylobacterium soli]KAB1068571.1 DDE-type integrase/transposase/recombinase [Methylobacterium soli]GJE45996.1 hypothetical protein AEGHOMDF_5196 [Methylobacterium soli]
MILNAIAAKLKSRSKHDFRGRHFEAALIVQAVSWYLRYPLSYRAIDEHGAPVDFLLSARRDLDAAKRFFRKMLDDQPLLVPDQIGTNAAAPYPPAIVATRKAGLLARTPVHYVTKHLQQGIESDHFRLKKNMSRNGGFRSFHTARRTIQGFGFAGAWTVREQNQLRAHCFGLSAANKA